MSNTQSSLTSVLLWENGSDRTDTVSRWRIEAAFNLLCVLPLDWSQLSSSSKSGDLVVLRSVDGLGEWGGREVVCAV